MSASTSSTSSTTTKTTNAQSFVTRRPYDGIDAVWKHSKHVNFVSENEREVGRALNTLDCVNFMRLVASVHVDTDDTAARVFAYQQPDGTLNNVWEYIDGPSLFACIRQATFGERKLFSLVVQVLAALQLANERLGFVHGDLHCENVLVVEDATRSHIHYEFADSSLDVCTFGVIAKIIDYGNAVLWRHNVDDAAAASSSTISFLTTPFFAFDKGTLNVFEDDTFDVRTFLCGFKADMFNYRGEFERGIDMLRFTANLFAAFGTHMDTFGFVSPTPKSAPKDADADVFTLVFDTFVREETPRLSAHTLLPALVNLCLGLIRVPITAPTTTTTSTTHLLQQLGASVKPWLKSVDTLSGSGGADDAQQESAEHAIQVIVKETVRFFQTRVLNVATSLVDIEREFGTMLAWLCDKYAFRRPSVGAAQLLFHRTHQLSFCLSQIVAQHVGVYMRHIDKMRQAHERMQRATSTHHRLAHLVYALFVER